MLRKLKKFSLIFSPKALLFLRSVGSLVKNQILEFLFFRTSLGETYCYCLPVVLSKKEEVYINFRVLHTKVKLFNSFTCKTTYSELLKELINILSIDKRKTFNYFRRIT